MPEPRATTTITEAITEEISVRRTEGNWEAAKISARINMMDERNMIGVVFSEMS